MMISGLMFGLAVGVLSFDKAGRDELAQLKSANAKVEQMNAQVKAMIK